MKSDVLIWKDTEKKGRSRVRDYRSCLKSLHIKGIRDERYRLSSSQSIRIELNARIDDLGQSIKPIQIKYWLEPHLNQSLLLSNVRRDEIQLHKC